MDEQRRWWVGIGVVVAVGLIGWAGYSAWVMTLDERHDDVRAVLQVDDRVAPGQEVGVQVTTTDAETGEPKSGREVVVELGEESESVAAGTTGEDGVFVAAVEAPDQPGDVQVGARVDSGAVEQVPSAEFSVDRAHSILVQTDKPRYQPGQDVQIRAIVRQLGGRAVEDDVDLRVEDPDGTVLFDRSVESNEHGMVQTEFPVVDVAPEGQYRIVAEYEDAEQAEVVEIEDYTLPEFEVDVDIGEGHYRPGQTVELEIGADYFFGEPVADGEFHIEGAGYVGEMEPFADIDGRLDGEGRASVEVQLPDYFVGADNDGQLGFATVEVEVTDGAGDTEGTVEEIPVAEDDILVDAVPAGGRLVQGVTNEVWITTRTPAGRPVGADVEITPENRDEPLVVETNDAGVGAVQFDPDEGGLNWSVRAVERDEEQRVGRTELSLEGDQTAQLGLVVERPAYETGQTVVAELVASRSSGYVYLEVVGDEGTHLTESVHLEDHRGSFDFDVAPEMSGMLEVRAWMVDPAGETRRAATLVPVVDTDQLDVDVTPTAEQFAPGEKAGIRVSTAEDGEPVAASVGLDVVDESVFAVGGDDRDEIVADRLGVEADLLEPTVWMYGAGRVGGSVGTDDGDETPGFHCGTGYAHTEPSSGLTDGFDEMIQSIHERQARQAGYNAVIVMVFLVLISLAFVGWVLAHRRRDWKEGETVSEAGFGWCAAGLGAAALFAVGMVFGGLVDSGAILVAALVPLGVLGWRLPRDNRRFEAGLMMLWAALSVVFVAALLLGGAVGRMEFVDLDVIADYQALIGVAFLAIPFGLAPVVGRWYSEERTLEALGLVVMAALAVGIFGELTFDIGWLAGAGGAFALGVGLVVFGAGETHRGRDGSVSDLEGADSSKFADVRDALKRVVAGVVATAVVGGVLWVVLTAMGEAGAGDMTFMVVYGGVMAAAALTASVFIRRRDGIGPSLLPVGAYVLYCLVLAILLHQPFGSSGGFEVILVVVTAMVVLTLTVQAGWRLMERNFGSGVALATAAATIGVPLVTVFAGLFQDAQQEVRSAAVEGAPEVPDAAPPHQVRDAEAPEPTLERRDQPETEDQQGGEDVEVREFFPETLYSDIVLTGEDGEAVVDLRMADSITNWKIDAVGATAGGTIGTASADATVFQPFFIEPQLPTSLTQGDRVVVPVSVFNYSEEILELTVELEDREWFEVDNSRAELVIEPDGVDRVEFAVTAVDHGDHTLEWTARGQGRAGEERYTDALRREIAVDPMGQRRADVASGRLDGTTIESVDVPSDVVEESQYGVVEFRPGVTGELVEGMEALIDMPTGCFEQTSSTLFPSAMALRYLEETERGSPELRSRAERYVAEGYQRILSFEVVDGGYSLFGRAPADPTVTAYGLRMLGEIDEVYPVDDQVLDEMAEFVVDNQNGNGAWAPEADTGYVVGIDDRLGLTAFIGWSLALYDPSNPAVGRAVDYVEANMDVEAAETRDLALALNLVVEADESARLQDRIVDELLERVVEDDQGDRWSRDEAGDEVDDAAAVENTALVARGLMASNRRAGLVSGAVEYLVESKSARGWGTTRATVAALGVLSSAAGLGETVDEGELVVRVDDEVVWSRQLDDETADEAHFARIELPQGTASIELEGPENSGYQWRLETRYHVPWDGARDAEEDDLTVEVDYDRTRLTVDDRVEVTASVGAADRVGMALVEVGIPPGFQPDTESLEAAVQSGEISDWELTERRATLYVEDVEAEIETSFEMVATQPIEASSGGSRTRDYYQPDRSAETGPVEFVVR